MNDEGLTRLVDRLNSDPQFRTDVQRDPENSLAAYRMSGGQILVATDEDALRRASAMGVDQDARLWTWVKKKMSRLFCGPGKTRSWECKNAPTQR